MMGLSVKPAIRRLDRAKAPAATRERHPPSKSEVRALFPNREILTERLVMAKSYVVRWMSEGRTE